MPSQRPLYLCIILAASVVVASSLIILGGCKDPWVPLLGGLCAALSVLVVSLIFRYIEQSDSYTRRLDRSAWNEENRRHRH